MHYVICKIFKTNINMQVQLHKWQIENTQNVTLKSCCCCTVPGTVAAVGVVVAAVVAAVSLHGNVPTNLVR